MKLFLVAAIILKVIEFQVDTVFDAILENMAERVKYEVVDATYDETDLDFACTKADNRFQGETEELWIFPNDQQNTSKIPKLPNQNIRQDESIKMGQFFFLTPFFHRFYPPPILGHFFTEIFQPPANQQLFNFMTLSGLDAEGQPMKPSKDPLFSCVKPDQETINTVKETMKRVVHPYLER